MSSAIVAPPAMIERPKPPPTLGPMPMVPRTKICRPSSPNTIDGTPARFEMFTWMMRVTKFFGAYSSR